MRGNETLKKCLRAVQSALAKLDILPISWAPKPFFLMWLVTTHKQEIKRARGPTIVVKVPNFIFDGIKIAWVGDKNIIDNKVRCLVRTYGVFDRDIATAGCDIRRHKALSTRSYRTSHLCLLVQAT